MREPKNPNPELLVYYPRKIKMIFTKSSKERTWEILYNSDKDKIISLIKFKKFPKYSDQEAVIEMNKKEFLELKRFFNTLKLGKNKTVHVNWMSKRLYESIQRKKKKEK